MKTGIKKLEEANKLWDYIRNNQDTDTGIIARKFGMTKDQVNKLTILWATGARDSFNQAFESMDII